jgi:hypothetical protein
MVLGVIIITLIMAESRECDPPDWRSGNTDDWGTGKVSHLQFRIFVIDLNFVETKKARPCPIFCHVHNLNMNRSGQVP